MSISKVVHKKTGNIYNVIFDEAIECTNGREDKAYVVYQRDGMTFVREAAEFWEKFEPITLSK